MGAGEGPDLRRQALTLVGYNHPRYGRHEITLEGMLAGLDLRVTGGAPTREEARAIAESVFEPEFRNAGDSGITAEYPSAPAPPIQTAPSRAMARRGISIQKADLLA